MTLSAITVLLTIIITGLLSIRMFFRGERRCRQAKKMDIDKSRNAWKMFTNNLSSSITNRAIVSMFAPRQISTLSAVKHARGWKIPVAMLSASIS